METGETGNRGFQIDVETVWNRTEPGPSCVELETNRLASQVAVGPLANWARSSVEE